ncbi:MAG TPA: hypothetical protein VHI13_00905 [Candidatus Kapabacteria bacterium]|nr:hypothetical protein [Candidatus Kapabacteria bacterium]
MNATITQRLITACAAACFAISAHPMMQAQGTDLVPHLSPDGIAVAAQQAKGLLAPDAELVFIGALGHSMYDAGGGTTVLLEVDLATGTSTAWVYAFYSPSKNERTMLAAVDIPDLGYQAMPASSPVPIPTITQAVETSLPYSSSAAMVGRLAADSVYRRYRAEYPAAFPQALAYRPFSDADSALLPAWFPRNAPVWITRFTGGGDSAMVCYVSGGNGATWCSRGAAASVPAGSSRRPDRLNLSSTGERRAAGH